VRTLIEFSFFFFFIYSKTKNTTIAFSLYIYIDSQTYRIAKDNTITAREQIASILNLDVQSNPLSDHIVSEGETENGAGSAFANPLFNNPLFNSTQEDQALVKELEMLSQAQPTDISPTTDESTIPSAQENWRNENVNSQTLVKCYSEAGNRLYDVAQELMVHGKFIVIIWFSFMAKK